MPDGINLLPQELREQKKISFKKRLPLVGIIVYFGLLAASGFFLSWKVSDIQVQLHETRNELEAIQPKLNETHFLMESIEEMKKTVEQLQKIQGSKSDWTSVLKQLNSCLPNDVWIVSLTLLSEGELHIKGKSENLDSIGIFVNRLNKQNCFKKVSLKAATAQDEEEGHLLFEITGEVAKDGGQ